MFGLLITIIIGFVVGVIAKFIMPGKENMGFIVTTLLGIAGSIAATYAGQAVGWYEAGQGAGSDRSDRRRISVAVDLPEVPVPHSGVSIQSSTTKHMGLFQRPARLGA